MGDMASGGAPRTKTLVTHLTTLAGAVDNGLMKTTLHGSDGTEVGTADRPIHVDIGGNVPDTMDIAKVGGADTAVGEGDADAGTLRVAIASDDVNLAAVSAALDITQSALRDAIRGTGTKDITTLEADVESVLAQVDAKTSTLAKESGGNLAAIKTAIEGTVKTSLQTAIPAGTNEVGGVNVTKIGGTATATGAGSSDAGTLRVAVATNDVNLAAIRLAQAKVATPIAKVETGSAAIAAVYTPVPDAPFWLEGVTVHFAGVPTTAGDLTVSLDAAAGAAYDTVVFRVDPSDDGSVDICYLPDRPVPCVAGDAVAVDYANADGLTYGVRIVTREV